jgi:hypothetical protein
MSPQPVGRSAYAQVSIIPSPEAQVELEKKRFLVDVMHRPATLHPLHSLAYYAYTRMYELLSTFFLGAGVS